MYLVKLRSCTLALPAPTPPPTWAEPLFDTPQLHARTSISSLCALSRASPLRSPILMNMSTAMAALLASLSQVRCGRIGGRGQREPAARYPPGERGPGRTSPGVPFVTRPPLLLRQTFHRSGQDAAAAPPAAPPRLRDVPGKGRTRSSPFS